MAKQKTVKQWAVQLLKVGISAAIIGYLVWDSVRRGEGIFSDQHGFNPEKFWQLVHHAGQHWYHLILAFVTATSGVLITFFRWWVLVRTVDVPLRLTESFRFSFMGFLFNLAPMGLVGGDLAKAILAARRFPDHRPETVASVFVDRVLGLYALFVVASGAILLTGLVSSSLPILQNICRLVLIVTVGATLVLIACWAPDVTGGNVITLMERVPIVGKLLARFVTAFRAYRHHPWILITSVIMTCPVHLLFSVSIYFIGLGLFDRIQPLARHFVFCPLAGVMQVIPVSIGPTEFVLDRLFVLMPLADGTHMLPGQGLVTLLVYRVFSLVLATTGLSYFFFFARTDWQEALREAEEAEEWEESATPASPVSKEAVRR
ncbi:lysylphosphatidylglycerol synthase transmembrane domain-containing protein [Thermogutta sp.]|uniref:lysylphosphatidylglycerol synthase transmembrane domain-containing protein n=1 Tax=Thermogutta sp. TaxID=1962930 RepID=UPI00321FE904